MVKAKVSLTATPNELQVISEALRMYSYVCKNQHRDDKEHPLDGFKTNWSIGANDPRRLAALSEQIRQDIGLKI